MARRARRQHIGDQGLVPAANGMVHRPAVHGDSNASKGHSRPCDTSPIPPLPTSAVMRAASCRLLREIVPRGEQAPSSASEVSTRSPPSSMRAEGNGLAGLRHAGNADRRHDDRSARSSTVEHAVKPRQASLRATQPRSTATTSAISPKPEPPTATRSSADRAPGGCGRAPASWRAPRLPRRKRKVWRCHRFQQRIVRQCQKRGGR